MFFFTLRWIFQVKFIKCLIHSRVAAKSLSKTVCTLVTRLNNRSNSLLYFQIFAWSRVDWNSTLVSSQIVWEYSAEAHVLLQVCLNKLFVYTSVERHTSADDLVLLNILHRPKLVCICVFNSRLYARSPHHDRVPLCCWAVKTDFFALLCRKQSVSFKLHTHQKLFLLLVEKSKKIHKVCCLLLTCVHLIGRKFQRLSNLTKGDRCV